LHFIIKYLEKGRGFKKNAYGKEVLFEPDGEVESG
jgi:hypothetical protein